MSPRIVFHGENAACFSGDFANLVKGGADVTILPDVLATEDERQAYTNADIIIGAKPRLNVTCVCQMQRFFTM